VPLDAPALKRLIIQGMAKASEPARPIVSHGEDRYRAVL
jgi:hypothetical protein